VARCNLLALCSPPLGTATSLGDRAKKTNGLGSSNGQPEVPLDRSEAQVTRVLWGEEKESETEGKMQIRG
jgi:hypothetical protein